MALEKTLLAVPVQLLSSDGGKYGQIVVPTTVGFKLKQRVSLFSNTQVKTIFEVKRVVDETNLLLGPLSPNLDDRSDLTLYVTATNAAIYADEQIRQAIPPDLYSRAVYEESPTVAIRTFQVDHLGRSFSVDNPFPVQLSNGSIDIGTVNAQLEMFITHKDNDPHPGDVHSSLRIGDGTDELEVNSDGSINVNVLGSGASDNVISTFNEISSVASGALTDIVTYTAPLGVSCYLSKIDYSGENIAKYVVAVNGTPVDQQRTYFGSSVNGTFNFANGSRGLKLDSGDVVTLKVIHSRPFVGDFNGRIQTVES